MQEGTNLLWVVLCGVIRICCNCCKRLICEPARKMAHSWSRGDFDFLTDPLPLGKGLDIHKPSTPWNKVTCYIFTLLHNWTGFCHVQIFIETATHFYVFQDYTLRWSACMCDPVSNEDTHSVNFTQNSRSNHLSMLVCMGSLQSENTGGFL